MIDSQGYAQKKTRGVPGHFLEINTEQCMPFFSQRNCSFYLGKMRDYRQFSFWIPVAPVVQRPDKFILWISHYLTVSICAKISVFPLVQANILFLTTVKFGSVRKPWTMFNVKYILDPE